MLPAYLVYVVSGMRCHYVPLLTVTQCAAPFMLAIITVSVSHQLRTLGQPVGEEVHGAIRDAVLCEAGFGVGFSPATSFAPPPPWASNPLV